MVTLSRPSGTTTNGAAAPCTKINALGTAFLAVIKGLVEVFTPFVTLALWQASFGLFWYFYPAAVDQFVGLTHVPWPVLAIACALVRMAHVEFLKR